VPRVLLLDDESLIAMVLEDFLTRLGFEIVGPAHTVGVAIGLIGSVTPNAAILDVNLRKEVSYPVADVLRNKRIPFMFLTCYIPEGLDPRFRDELIASKPFDMRVCVADFEIIWSGAHGVASLACEMENAIGYRRRESDTEGNADS
jgi:DNA-binding response OmpR family regulator